MLYDRSKRTEKFMEWVKTVQSLSIEGLLIEAYNKGRNAAYAELNEEKEAIIKLIENNKETVANPLDKKWKY